MRKNKNHGGANVEFALISPFLVGLIVGTLIYGTRLTKELELQQIARDTASMCARGTDFTIDSGNQPLVSRLGQELGWPNSGGLLSGSPGVVYVSTIEYLDATCNTGSNVNICQNHDRWVFVRSVAFGNTAMRSSNFGAPAPCIPGCWAVADGSGNNSDGALSSTDVLNNSGARVTNFSYLGTPSNKALGFQPGQPAYLVEVAGVTGPWNGGSISYAFSIF